MTLAEIREWLKAQITCPNWYIGKIDGSKSECIGVFSVPGPSPRIAVGGLENTGYSTKSVSILVHWGKNANLAEIKAQEVYNSMFGKSAVIGGKNIPMFQMVSSEPVGIATDDEGIFEYVINTNIIFER